MVNKHCVAVTINKAEGQQSVDNIVIDDFRIDF